MTDRPIPTDKLIPVVFACGAIAVLALLGAPEIILIPIGVITLIWLIVLVARHYLGKET